MTSESFIEVPTPPGDIIFAGRAADYANAMRAIFRTPSSGYNVVLVTVDSVRTWVLVVPDLVVCFTALGPDAIGVRPSLLLADPTMMPPLPWPPANFVQPAIDATQEFLLRVAPVGRTQ